MNSNKAVRIFIVLTILAVLTTSFPAHAKDKENVRTKHENCLLPLKLIGVYGKDVDAGIRQE